MPLLRDIKGQNNAVRYLSRSLASGRLAASYLFFGPGGSGRALCAKAFAAELFCAGKKEGKGACGLCPACRRVDQLQHPDILWIAPEKNKAIKIDQMRKVKERLSLKPFEAPASVCVIEDAHMMTQEASNALLKVLEEPPGDSVLILITDKKELLLETVISRCTEVRFRALPSAEAPGVLKTEGAAGRKQALAELVSGILSEPDASCLDWDNDDKDLLIEDLEMLIMFLRDAALGREGLEDRVFDRDIFDTRMYDQLKGYSPDSLYRMVERLVRMKQALAGNVNPRIAAQALPAIFHI